MHPKKIHSHAKFSQDKTHLTHIKTPAFWDLHIHGAYGFDFMKIKPTSQVIKTCSSLGAHGIGAFAPTLLTSNPASLETACENWGRFLSELCAQKNLLSEKAAIPIGLHLEGPFLNPEMAGAHPKKAIKKPDIKYLLKLYKLARGQIKIITLAPELEGSIDLIKTCKKLGIRVQMGHTQAQHHDIKRAISACARGVTHLYNAMCIHHRRPAFIPFLSSKKLTAEIITDTLHLDADFVHFLLSSSIGPALYSVTDGCSVLGLGSGSTGSLGDLKIQKNGLGAYSGDTLAGSAVALVKHPSLLRKRWLASGIEILQPHTVFPLFYAHQRELFPDVARLIKKRTNTFNAKTWKFISMSVS